MHNLLTVSEVAKVLRVESATVLRWIKRGSLDAVLLPCVKNKLFRIKRETLDNLLGGASDGK